MSVLDLASAARSASGYATFSALDAYPEFIDSDGYSRTIAVRDSDQSPHAIYARGVHTDLVETHNERSRLTFERKSAQDMVDQIRADAEPAEPDADILAEAVAEVESLDADLASLVKTRAVATVHVARTLAHYGSD